MKVQINRKFSVEADNIDRIVETEKDVRVYLKKGYPKILIADCDKSMVLLRMVNMGVSSKRIGGLAKQTRELDGV